MTSSPGRMELSDPPPDAQSDPFGSFPLSDPTIILGDIEVEASSPTLPRANFVNPTATYNMAPPSSDFLEIPLSQANFSAASPRLIRPIRKRGPDFFPNVNQTNKTLRFSQESIKSLRDLILNAQDLIVQAYTLTKSREEQSKLLDLLEIFREYTEKGRIQAASSIIASQVAHLETATRQIESKAKTLARTSTPINNQPANAHTTTGNTPPTFANIASQGATNTTSTQEWTIVGKKNKVLPSKPMKPTTQNRLILVRSITDSDAALSPQTTRDALNKAFSDKGIREPVVAAVSKTRGQNLVLITTTAFCANFLLEKQDIWQYLVPFKAAQKDEPWHKVALHGVPIAAFNTSEGMALVSDEIQTFNKGLKPIGTPYWLTSAEKRLTNVPFQHTTSQLGPLCHFPTDMYSREQCPQFE
jgi:hypothetical protein